MTAVTIRNLNVVVRDGTADRTLFDHLSASFDWGQFVCILGPSGSGKTTLLNILAGLVAGYSGEVEIDTFRLDTMSEDERTVFRRGHVGYLFQNSYLIRHLSIKQNVDLPARFFREFNNSLEPNAVLGRFGLGDAQEKRAEVMSGGERQRVALARALTLGQTILLVDEPTGNLDLAAARTVLEDLRNLARTGRLIIMVTHSLEAADYADRRYRLSDGKLIEDPPMDTSAISSGTNHNTSVTNKNLVRTNWRGLVGFAWANAWRAKNRTFSILAAVFVGALLMSLLMLLVSGVEHRVLSQLPTSGIAARSVTIEAPPGSMLSTLTPAILHNFRELPQVENVWPQWNSFSLSIQLANGHIVPLSLQTLIPIQSLDPHGVTRKMATSSYGIILPKKQLNVLHIPIRSGQKVILKGKLGKAIATQVIGFSSGALAYVPSGFVHAMTQSHMLSPNPNAAVLVVRHQNNVKSVAEVLSVEGYTVIDPASEVIVWHGVFHTLKMIFGIGGIIALLLSSIYLALIMQIAVLERTPEIALFKVMGLRRREITVMLVFEGGWVGLLGTLSGVLVATMVSWLALLWGHAPIAFRIVPLAVVVCAGTGISMVASWAGSKTAVLVDAARVLR